MRHINFGNIMRIAVCDLGTGNLDILILDVKAEEAFDSYEDASDFFTDLGYDIDYISWMVIDGLISEQKVTAKNERPIFKD